MPHEIFYRQETLVSFPARSRKAARNCRPFSSPPQQVCLLRAPPAAIFRADLSRSVSIFKQQGTSPCTLFPFQMLSSTNSFMTFPRGSFVLREKPFLSVIARNNSGFPFPYYYIEKLCLLKVAATETFFQLIPYRRICPYAISFAIRQRYFLSLFSVCALKNLPAPRVPKGMRPLKIKITSFHSLSHSIVPKMFPVLSAESAPYYVQYSRNEPPFCKPYARRRFPFHTDKSPRYSFCFFLSVLNLFKKKIFLFSHNIQPQSKRFANVFATSQFFPKPFAFSLLPPD